MNKLPISAIVLTYNEEKNIGACLESLADWVEAIYVVDSFSVDETVTVSKSCGAQVFQHTFVNQAIQMNWALENLAIETEWAMRIDADEYVTPGLKRELFKNLLNQKKNVNGVFIKRQVHFMGRWIRHGTLYPVWTLRIWRRGKARCEERGMDEHMKVVEGGTAFVDGDIVDNNKKDLSWWVGKHNSYATREAVEILNMKYEFSRRYVVEPDIFGTPEKKKRWLKEKVYARLPLFIRPFLYFMYRYFIRLGFLDGKEGLIFHFLQGFWYRFLVDAKIYEIRKKAADDKLDVKDAIIKHYGVK